MDSKAWPASVHGVANKTEWLNWLMLCFVLQSCMTLCDPMNCAHQAPLSMGFFRQEYWTGLSSLLPGDLPNPGIKPTSPSLQVDAIPSEPPRKPFESLISSISRIRRRKYSISHNLYSSRHINAMNLNDDYCFLEEYSCLLLHSSILYLCKLIWSIWFQLFVISDLTWMLSVT